MQLTYNIQDKPPFRKTLVFAFQQMIAIMAATLLVPLITSTYKTPDGSTLLFDAAAALCGAGFGTIVYILFTKGRSPVFLGSSFTFLSSYSAVIGAGFGYWGVLIGIAMAGLVYVVMAIIIKFTSSAWVNKLLPPVIIGPIVALIGLSLSSTATGWAMNNGSEGTYNFLSIICALATFFVIVICSVKGNKTIKLIPFIIGIGAGYLLALIFTLIGIAANVEYMQILSFSSFESLAPFSITSIFDYPKFTLLQACLHPEASNINWAAIGSIAIIFVPIAVVELAQHVADHKNLSSIIEKDLITDPGLDKTLLGDGVGSIVGGLVGGAANTTYGESIGCVAITGNASIVSIFVAACGCILLSFVSPFVALINSIPKCVMGGACIALYGFIAVSGLQMLHNVDLGDNRNLFPVAAIFVCGIGGLVLTFTFGKNTIQLTSLAFAMIIGIVTNLITHSGKDKETAPVEEAIPSESKAIEEPSANEGSSAEAESK